MPGTVNNICKYSQERQMMVYRLCAFSC